MGHYLLHYWNLFHDFAAQFRGVVYRQIPLPLLANFYKYLSDPLKARMRRRDFYAADALSIRRREDLFPAFNRLLGAAARKAGTGLSGRVLVHVDYVRLPAAHYSELFVQGNTLLLGRGGPETLFGHPLLNIRDYTPDVSGAVLLLQRKVKEAVRTARFPVPTLTRELSTRLLNDLPRMAETVEAVRRLLDAHPVSCVVVGTTEDLLSRCLVLAASVRGIPSLCLQHGLIMGEEAYFPVFATRMAVYGRTELCWYLQRGVPRERIAVIGHPRYDLLRSRYPASGRDVLVGEGLDPHKKTVLVATQPGSMNRWLPFIRRLAGKFGLQVLVKPHPLEIGRGTARAYTATLRTLPRTSVITRHVEMGDYLAAVDAVAVQTSTVGLEAMLCQKPLFVLRDRLPDRDYDYYDGLAPFVQEDPVKLANLLYFVIGRGRLQGRIAVTRRQFLRMAYPVALAGPVLAKQISLWTGTLSGCLQSAFDGQLVKGDRDEVYRIENGSKRHIAGLSVFAAAGYRWEDVCHVDNRILDRIPSGPAMVRAEKPPGERGVLDRLAGRLNGILVQGSGHEVYLLERGTKRHIATEQTFARMRFNWGNVCRLDDRILCSIPSGPFIG